LDEASMLSGEMFEAVEKELRGVSSFERDVLSLSYP
jgi:hypothetical protein